MKQAERNHLRRLLAWVNCEIGSTPEELEATLQAIAAKLPADTEISDAARQRMVEAHDRARQVPGYIRAAVKSLDKLAGQAGEIIDATGMRDTDRRSLDELHYSGKVQEMRLQAAAQEQAQHYAQAPHAELRKTWAPGQHWQYTYARAGRWIDLEETDIPPSWLPSCQYRRRPDAPDISPQFADELQKAREYFAGQTWAPEQIENLKKLRMTPTEINRIISKGETP